MLTKPVLAGLTAVTLLAAPAQAQIQAREAQISSPTPPEKGPETGLAGVDVKGHDRIDCPWTSMHLTVGGMLVICIDKDKGQPYIFAIDDSKFPGRSQIIADILLRQRAINEKHVDNPHWRGHDVTFTHREPSEKLKTLCEFAPSASATCREAVNVRY